jgi:pyruvate dehydrogenase (quinone)
MVGSTFPYSEFLPPEGKARGVQIDIDARMLRIRYPTEVNGSRDSSIERHPIPCRLTNA